MSTPLNTRRSGVMWLQSRIQEVHPLVFVSKLYSGDESSTGKSAWRFEFPQAVASDRAFDHVHLLCAKDGAASDFYHLRVPTSYLQEQCTALDVRRDTGKFTLILSAENSQRFVDQRSEGSVRFDSFLQ